MSQENAVNAQENVGPLQITISGVLSLLSQGKNRKEIADHYGKTQTEMNLLVWSHPKLKGRKIKKQYTGIELIDDLEEEETVAEVAETVEVQAEVETVVEEELNTAPGEPIAQYENGTMVGSASTEDWK